MSVATAIGVFAPPNRTALEAALDAWDASPSNAMGANVTYGPVGYWDVTAVSDLSDLFAGRASFDEPLGWDTSSVTSMARLFSGASAFNQALSFDTRSVLSMDYMFLGARGFDQRLAFDVSNVTSMLSMLDDTALGNCSKRLTEDTLSASTAWPYAWAAFGCPSPSPPPSLPPSPPRAAPYAPSAPWARGAAASIAPRRSMLHPENRIASARRSRLPWGRSR
jgi:hypothetical protein